MVALILADGDAPDPCRARRRLAGLGRRASTSSSRPTAARATPRRSASRIDLWVGDGDSLGEDGIAALAAAGVPIERSPAGQGRDRHRARGRRGRGARRAGHRHRRRARRRAHRPRPRQRRAAGASRPRRPAGGRCSTAMRGSRSCGRPAPTARRATVALAGRPGSTRLAAAARRRRRRRDDDRPRLPARRRAAARSARRAASRTSSPGPARRSAVRRGLLLVIESPATL